MSTNTVELAASTPPLPPLSQPIADPWPCTHCRCHHCYIQRISSGSASEALIGGNPLRIFIEQLINLLLCVLLGFIPVGSAACKNPPRFECEYIKLLLLFQASYIFLLHSQVFDLTRLRAGKPPGSDVHRFTADAHYGLVRSPCHDYCIVICVQDCHMLYTLIQLVVRCPVHTTWKTPTCSSTIQLEIIIQESKKLFETRLT